MNMGRLVCSGTLIVWMTISACASLALAHSSEGDGWSDKSAKIQRYLRQLQQQRAEEDKKSALICVSFDQLNDISAKMHEPQQKQLDMIISLLQDILARQPPDSAATSARSDLTIPPTTSPVARPRDCADVMRQGDKQSGVYTVYIGSVQRPLDVYCDMTTDGGGWTVFQRRKDGSENFYRNWTDYAEGFGNLNGEFWLGNDKLHLLTSDDRSIQLRIDMQKFDGEGRYALYSNFKVASAADKYKLSSVGTFQGTAGDSLSSHVGFQFSTFDADNDIYPNSCAVTFKGAWWYEKCHWSNLNGLYHNGAHSSYADGINWYAWTGYYYSLKFTEMKIRPTNG